MNIDVKYNGDVPPIKFGSNNCADHVMSDWGNPNGADFNLKASAGIDTSKRREYRTAPSINTAELMRSGFTVQARYDNYGAPTSFLVESGLNNVTASEVFDIVASCNEDIVVTYRGSLDEESAKLARKTKKPLWVISTDRGAVTLERAF